MSVSLKPTVVILGGGYAGLLACARLAQVRPAARIVLIDAKGMFVQRIRLHEALAGRRPAQFHYRDVLPAGVVFRQATVQHIDTVQRCLQLADGAVQAYDYLVYALGSVMRPTIPGGEHAHCLETTMDSDYLFPQLQALAPCRGRILVLGAGLAGLEIATELAERWPALQILLVCRGEFGLAFNPRGRVYALQQLVRAGVTLREHTTVVQLQSDTAQLQDGTQLPFDLCLWAGGFGVPALARNSGLPTDAHGRVRVDTYLRAESQERVFALGDAAHVTDTLGRSLRMACASAMPQGVHGGNNLLRLLRGKVMLPFRFAYPGICVSLGRNAGLIQLVDELDRPGTQVITGRWGARLKEWVCRYTWLVLRLELRGIPIYSWRRGRLPRQNDLNVANETETT